MRSKFLVLLLALSVSAKAAPFTVVLDPGHGGKDDGAVTGPHTESILTLKISQLIHDQLKKDKRFRVYLTRETNRFVTLPERARIAHSKKADVFVSIHANSSPDKRAHGAEFYFQNQLPPDEESMLLAHRENSQGEYSGEALTYSFLESGGFAPEVTTIIGDLLDSNRVLRSSILTKSLRAQWRGSKKSKSGTIRQAPFYVLSHMTLPSTLVELGFLTHPDDLNYLTSTAQQTRMAEDIYRGIVAYKEAMDKFETAR